MNKEKSTLYIEAYDEGSGCFSISIESLLILQVYQLCDSDSIDLKIKFLKNPSSPSVKINKTDLSYTVYAEEINLTTYCIWPMVIVGNRVVAGLSAVARQIIRGSNNPKNQYLLGFRESCLMACSESSIWTMFCEVDMPESLKTFLNNIHGDVIKIPNTISRFEYHMEQPVRIHNIYKIASIESNKKIATDTPKNELNLQHTFAEGPSMTISDVILYPCFDILFKSLENDLIKSKFPVTFTWYQNMQSVINKRINVILTKIENNSLVIIDENFIKQSLYRSDMSHYKMEKKMYTKQSNIDIALAQIDSLKINIFNSNSLYGSEIPFNWNDIPVELNPCGGSLPEKRADRKCEQLESMIKSIINIADNSKSTIVDFCSGSGHLGLLLAYLLPMCQIILVENKEKSLDRAKQRIEILNLKNAIIVQSNLDYFSADFNIGVSLHACGTATDLVIQTCVNKNAHFVCCPCCYGGIKNCHIVNYPRSKIFSNLKELTYKNYLSLAHAADQTHDTENVKTKQGFKCMDIIDTDRKLYAENIGYKVFLGKLQPITCTNKNNLIVGIRN